MSNVPPGEAAARIHPIPESPESTKEEVFQTDNVTSIVGGHFVHDTFTAFLAPLLPLMRTRLGTGYALAGGLAVYTQLPSLMNPFIGYLADRVSLRYFIIVAPGMTATLMSLLGLVNNYVSAALLLLATGFSIAAFHAPAPAMIGRISGGKVGRGMSFFMAGGELGRTLGPIIAVAAVGWFGLDGMWRLAFVGWAASVILYFRLRHISARPASVRQDPVRHFWQRARNFYLLLGWLILARVFLLVALTVYLPIFVSDERSGSLWLAASALVILEAAGVVGALTTGSLSDRLGRKRVLGLLLLISPFLLLGFLQAPTWLAVPILVGLGLTAISPQPVILAMVQDQFPDHRALANGTYLGMGFLVRSIGIFVVGLVADQFDLYTAFYLSALLAFGSLPALYWLPTDRSRKPSETSN